MAKVFCKGTKNNRHLAISVYFYRVVAKCRRVEWCYTTFEVVYSKVGGKLGTDLLRRDADIWL